MRIAELARDLGIAKQARDTGQRLEMVGAGTLRGEQQENQIDRLAVERLEIDRALQPREQAEHVGELGELAVRDGDAVADSGGTELFTLQQDFEDGAIALAGPNGGAPCPV